MTKLIYIPLEPLEHRCFGHWYDALFEAFTNEFEAVIRIAPHNCKIVDAGNTGIMDTLSSTKWKLWQLENIRQLFEEGQIEPNDVFFFDDLYFPGIEIVKYISDLLEIPISITGCLHGGSWIYGDYVKKMGDWPISFESMMFLIADKIILATEYHRGTIINAFDTSSRYDVLQKLYVTGYPVQYDDIREFAIVPTGERENIIVYAQRVDDQKRTNEVIKHIQALWHLRKDFKFVMTSSTTSKLSANTDLSIRIAQLQNDMRECFEIKEGLSRDDYFKLLGKSKVFISMAKGETFGYALVESLAAGVSPVVCSGVTHDEILLDDTRFVSKDMDSVPDLLSERLDHPIDMHHLVHRYRDEMIFGSIAHIVKNPRRK